MQGQRGLQGRFIGSGAVVVLSTYALFIGGAWAPTYSVSLRVLSLILAATGIAIWAIFALRDPCWHPRTALGPAFVAALAAFIVSTLASRFPRLGFEYLAWSIVLSALYLILHRLMASVFFRHRLITFATLAGLVIGVWYLVVVISRWVEWWGLVGRVTAPPLRPGFESLMLGNPSAVMTASVLLALPAVATLLGASRARTALAIVVVVVSLCVVIASGSRAGWLAIALTAVVIGGVWLAAPERRAALTAALGARWIRIGAIPVVLILAALAAFIAPGLLLRANAGGESARMVLAIASFRMFQSSPIFGTGPGTWAPLRVANTLPDETDYYIPHAHNLYVETLAEFGLLGIIAGLIAALALARLLRSAIRDRDPLTRRMGWAALIGSVYFAAHQLLDFYANLPAILFAFAIPIAWLDAARERDPLAPGLDASRRVLPRSRKVLAAGGLVAVLTAVGYLGWSERAAYHMEIGTNALNNLAPHDAVPQLEAAVGQDPAMPPYHFALGLALANTGQTVRAEGEFLASASADDLPEAWLNLAALRVRLGDAEGATDALHRAMRLGYQQPAVSLGAGELWLQLGERDAAIAAYVDSVLLLPSLAGDPWWVADADRASAWRTAYSTAFAGASSYSRFEMALETDDMDSARAALDDIASADLRETSALVLASWSGSPDAARRLEQLARERPLDNTLVNWCARVLRHVGDAAAAKVYEPWAESLSALSSTAGFEARVVGDREGFRVAGVSSLFYGHFSYRRPTPSNQLIDGLPHLAFR